MREGSWTSRRERACRKKCKGVGKYESARETLDDRLESSAYGAAHPRRRLALSLPPMAQTQSRALTRSNRVRVLEFASCS